MSDKIVNMLQIRKILTEILSELEANNIPYALVGALAFAYWGYQRYTSDIDFLVKWSDADKIKSIMGKYGYSMDVDTDNATQFTHTIGSMVQVDYLYARRDASLKMIERARSFEKPDRLAVNVALPEDLIALKLQAILLNPKREYKDMADIQALVELTGDKLDWTKLSEYCGILSMESYLEKIRQFAK